MDPLWISLLVGLGVGIVVSVVFGIYSKTTASAVTRTIFGITSGDLIEYVVFAFLGASAVFMTVMSILVRDTTYPTSQPWKFSIETLLMAFLSSSIVLIMAGLRNYPLSKIWKSFLVLTAKFGVLHLLFQFSGFYSSVVFT